MHSEVGNRVTTGTSEQKLLYRSYYDEVSGLPKRSLANALINAAIQRAADGGQLVAIVMLDIDNFRQINDRLGYAAGDAVLHEVARRLEGMVRREDTVLRAGNDEFCVVLTGLRSAEELGDIIARLLAIFAAPIPLLLEKLQLTGRFGSATYPRDGSDPEALLQNAEIALLEARRQTGAVLLAYSAQRGLDAREKLRIEGDLRAALGKENALEMHYQPQIDGATGRPIGAEALVRWQHPLLGWIPPVVFVQLAESNGTIAELGHWVLRRIARQIAEWRAAGNAILPVSVNVSPAQLAAGDFFDTTIAALAEFGTRPEDVKLELTETSIIPDLDHAARVLSRFRDFGIATVIDDFGTGNSSLTVLASLPIDELKIDQSFVRQLQHDEKARRIVDATLGLAKSLGMSVVAEGVSDRWQLDWLLGRGCPIVQGHFFSKPLQSEDFARDWLAALAPAAG